MTMVCPLHCAVSGVPGGVNGVEIANNGYRDGYSGLRNTEDSFLNYGPQISVDQRKLNAVRAYFEWMPIR